MKDLTEILKSHPFIQGFKEEHVELMVGCASNVVFKAGEYLGREGQEANQFFIIREGKVALDINAAQKGKITIQTIESGELIGWSWMVLPFRWHFDLRAVADVRAIALDGACLRKKCENDYELGYTLSQKVMYIMDQRLKASRIQLLDMYSKE